MIKYIAIYCIIFYLGFSFKIIEAEKTYVNNSIEWRYESLITGNLTYILMTQMQLSDYDNEQILGNSIKELFTIILVIISIIMMMLTPLILFYFMLSEYFNYRNIYRLIESGEHLGIEDKSDGSLTTSAKKISNRYLQFYSRFMGNGIGFICWIALSLWYIILGFNDYKSGLEEYFYFPFKIFNLLINKKFIDSLDDMYMNWIYMILIMMISFLSFLIGKSIGNFIGKERINKIESKYQNKDI